MKLSQNMKSVLLSLTAFLLLIAATPSFKSKEYNKIRNPIRIFFQFFGISQNWGLFAPNPVVENRRLSVEVIMRSGEHRIWRPQPYFESSYMSEQWRKWGMDNLSKKQHKKFWPSALTFATSQVLKPRETFLNVASAELWIEYYPVPPLTNTDDPKKSTFLSRDSFATALWKRRKIYEQRF